MNKGYSEKEFALFSARKIVDEAVFNMASYEGNPFTFVEVKTLLDGVTVGGHKLSDQNQILRLRRTWDELFQMVESNAFDLSKSTALQLHAILGEHEALEWGVFRSGRVRIAGTHYTPPEPSQLEDRFDSLITDANESGNSLDRAIRVFLECARSQFFFDCNKRMGQFLMNGILLSNGQHIVTIPAKDKQQYDQAMLRYYDTGDSSTITQFLELCQTKLAKGLGKSSQRGSNED
ncbi:MAG: Fic family protein [Gammaproteobacteria bacterium]|nr:Fic family protein [Gammaproteobacteria bacterium]